jgi:hypothetical protein
MASLLALYRAEFEEAKKRFRYRYWANVGTLAAGLAVIVSPPPLTYLLAVLGLLTQVAAWWLRYEGGRLQGIAEEARRRSILIGALGATQEPLDTTDLRQRFSHKAEKESDKYEDTDYYASTEPPGPERFRDYLQESAFWSKHLYAAAARKSFIAVAVFLATVLVVALIALLLVSGSVAVTVVRAFVVFLGFLPASDELGRALAWRAAAIQADAVDRRLERLDGLSTEPALAVFGDYSVATVTAPPIPTSVHDSEQVRLNQLWAERRD